MTFMELVQLLEAGKLSPRQQVEASQNLVHLAERAKEKGVDLVAIWEGRTQNERMVVDQQAQAVQQYVLAGMPLAQALQKVAREHKTSVFNVSKRYRAAFSDTESG